MSEKISRRNFLRTATLGAAAAGLLAGCGNSTASGSTAASTAAGTYTAGTYSATATGINTTTPVTVTMTFSADAITDVQIDVANETKGYGADIADEMVKKILDAQSSEVDGHSGATITSGAIKKAAESCINQAKGVAVAPTEASKAETVVPDGLTTEEVESSVVELGDITPDETKDFDVVVVGAGAAGVPAAGWAAELGGHVALLQKQNIVVSQGNCGSAIIKSKSTEAGKKMWVHMTNGLCDWRADTSLLNAYVENSEEALMWYLNRAGLTDQTEYGDGSLVDSNKDPSSLLHNDEKEIFAYMCTSQDLTGVWKDRMDTYDFGDEHCYFFAPWIGPKPKNVGDVLATVLENVQAKNSNLEAFFNTPAVKLVHENGKVTGVIAKDESGKYIQFNASKGVVLATGGYEGDMDMYRQFNGGDRIYNAGSPYVTGDGVKMEMALGAQLWHMDGQTMSCGYFHGIKVPDFETTFVRQFYMAHGAWMEVAADGTRYYNEAKSYQRQHMKYYEHGKYVDVPIARQQPVHMIMDDNCFKAQPLVNAWIGWPVTCRNPYHWSDDNSVELEKGWIIKADTIEELAEKIGKDPAKLRAEVDKFNAMVDAGEDTDFGRDITTMAKIEQGPFYAVEEVPSMPACSGGARRNIKGQVLNWDGEPIEGLYSAGEIGSLVCNLYQNGTYLHEAICSGRAAVDTMLGGRAELTPTFGGGAAAPWAEAADGDYSVMVQGLHDPFEVIYTIKDKQLVGIAVGEGRENMFMNDEQFAAFTKQIIETQDMGVDAVSGATVDCQAITGGIMTAFSHKTS